MMLRFNDATPDHLNEHLPMKALPQWPVELFVLCSNNKYTLHHAGYMSDEGYKIHNKMLNNRGPNISRSQHSSCRDYLLVSIGHCILICKHNLNAWQQEYKLHDWVLMVWCWSHYYNEKKLLSLILGRTKEETFRHFLSAVKLLNSYLAT